MKITLILFLIMLIPIHGKDNFEINPFNFDLKGLEAKGNTIVAYGSFGSALISYDAAENWGQIRPFKKGNIINFFIEDDKLTAISNIGEIKISIDNGKSWLKAADLQDSITYAIPFPEGYFLRSKSKIFKLSKEFEYEKEYPMEFADWWDYSKDVAMWSRRSMIFIEDNIIAESDSSMLIKFDINLKPVDSLSFKELGICDNCIGAYNLYNGNDCFYARVYDGDNNGSIYKITDFNKAEEIFNFGQNVKMFPDSSYPHYFKVIDNKKYSVNLFGNGPVFKIFEIINNNTANEIGIIDCSILRNEKINPIRLHYHDFIIHNDRFAIVANDKFLNTVNLKNGTGSRISDLTLIDEYNDFAPDKISESSFLYYTQKAIYRSTDNGITFHHEKADSVLLINERPIEIKFKKYYPDKKILYLGGYPMFNIDSSLIFKSNDNGKTLGVNHLENLEMHNQIRISNFVETDNGYLICQNSRGDKQYNWIYEYDKDFNLIYKRFDSNYTIDYIYPGSNNEYTILSREDSKTEPDNVIKFIKYSNDKGNTWETIKKFDYWEDTIWFDEENYYLYPTSNLIHFDEVSLFNNDYWLLFNYDGKDSIFTIETLNLESKEIDLIYQRKILEGRIISGVGAAEFKDTVYLAIHDSLFVTNDLFDKTKWKIYVFPDDGMIRGKLKKFDDKIFAIYQDSINVGTIYWIKLPGQPNSVKETEIEVPTYLYSYPPYPLPAKNKVTSKIYWDPIFSIEDASIVIYNIFGEKLEGKRNVTIDMVNNYCGYLRWNCTAFDNGIYFIRIKHGTNTRIIKVIIAK